MRTLFSIAGIGMLFFGCAPEGPPEPPVSSGTVVAGEDFFLQWPASGRPKACITIPADAVPSGTEVSIQLNTDAPGQKSEWPAPFRDWAQDGTPRRVYMPIVDFSADPAFTIEDPEQFFTIGICARYNERPGDPPSAPGGSGRVAHPAPSGETLELLPPAEDPCGCGGNPQTTQGPVQRLIGGSPFSATALEATVSDQGLGGKGGSFSPFAVVRP